MWYEATPYSPLEQVGRGVYQREGCWYCHSQFVRPVAGEDQRWGPVAEVGEYAYDFPHLLSTRRIGPDLSRVGLKFSDHWHFAHHWEPHLLVPDSVMPEFQWLYRSAPVPVVERDGAPALGDSARPQGAVQPQAGPKIPLYSAAPRASLHRRHRRHPGAGGHQLPEPYENPSLEGPDPHRDRAVEDCRRVAYTPEARHQRGAWREVFEPQAISASVMTLPAPPSRWRAARCLRAPLRGLSRAPQVTATAPPPPSRSAPPRLHARLFSSARPVGLAADRR